MKQTEQYGLNQWELTDRILMSDFNADNAKIAAALAGKMGRFELLRSSVLDESYGPIGFNPSIDNWNEVEMFALFVHPTIPSHELSNKLKLTLDYKNGQTEQPIEAALLEPASVLLLLFPLHDENRLVEGVAIGGGTKVFQMSFPFKQLGYIRFGLANEASLHFQRCVYSRFRIR